MLFSRLIPWSMMVIGQ